MLMNRKRNPVRYRSQTRRALSLLARLAIVETMLLPLLGCDPFNAKVPDDEVPYHYVADDLTPAQDAPDELLVMTYNVKFAGGRIDFFFDCIGDRVLMDEEEVEANLAGLAAKIRQVNPDIVLLQEVDVASKRVAYLDMMRYLVDHTDLNYGVYATQWRADYVPSDGLGYVDSGNAILSRWPLENAERIPLPLIEEQDALTRYFWLRRNILKARVALPERDDVWVLNVHTAAFSQDGTKKKQIDRFKEEMDALASTGATVVGGGDLNTLPPGSEQTSDFEDSFCEGEFEADDYREEEDWLDALYAEYEEAIPLASYREDNSRYFTHTVDGTGFWTRRLDYLFTNSSFRDGLVHQSERFGGMETMPLSDHAPVTAKVRLR